VSLAIITITARLKIKPPKRSKTIRASMQQQGDTGEFLTLAKAPDGGVEHLAEPNG